MAVLVSGNSIFMTISSTAGIVAVNSLSLSSGGLGLYLGITAILAAVLITLDLFITKRLPKIFYAGRFLFGNLIGRIRSGKIVDDNELYSAISTAGYSYDPKQDIFYSNKDAWQMEMGYCRLYDEAAAPMGMIIDSEPVYFKIHGKRWLIEFWKGQYDLTTGCEIGIYNTEGPDLEISGVFSGTFYKSAAAEDQLYMSCTLKKNGTTILTREDTHWWLTGFKLGEYSEPSELTLDLSIAFKDKSMMDAFIRGLRRAGYSGSEFNISENTITLTFDKPHTPQPLTRTEETDWLVQKKNRFMCEKYQQITKGYDNFPDKMKALQEQAPLIYDAIINMGKSEKVFKAFSAIRGYLE
ncbi:MAG: DUF4474 domain-containing protein [Bacillota bacterium]|nr:DUF4474 domain-containing protein [Bacillota bacterium]